MTRKRATGGEQPPSETGSKKVGIMLPGETYGIFEQIARDQHITVAQVVARLAIEFAEVEREANQLHRETYRSYREGLLGKRKPASQRATTGE
ncbi:MAG TPA: hypothetical protein VKC34_00430 [Blastocatellia bacterium]|nr:hypothetical protein [Blastocatellia bacterium]